MERSLVMFLTHDFKPVFESTLKGFDSFGDGRADGVVLFDAESPHYREVGLERTRVEMVRTEIGSYDPLRPRKSHNLMIQYLSDNFSLTDEYDYFWVVENDVYHHGGMLEALLPHVCLENGYEIQQFIPDYVCSVNTFRCKFTELIERDILEGSERYLERKMYHPIKL